MRRFLFPLIVLAVLASTGAAQPVPSNVPPGGAPKSDSPAATPRVVELSSRSYVIEWLSVAGLTIVAVMAVGRSSRRVG